MEATVSYLLMLQKYINSKQKTEIKPYILWLGNILIDFTIDNMKKTGLKGVVKVFSVDCNVIDTKDTLDIHRNLMKEIYYIIIFIFFKKMFIGLIIQ